MKPEHLFLFCSGFEFVLAVLLAIEGNILLTLLTCGIALCCLYWVRKVKDFMP